MAAGGDAGRSVDRATATTEATSSEGEGMAAALNALLASDAVQRLGISGLSTGDADDRSRRPLVVTAVTKFGFGQSNPTFLCTAAPPGIAVVLRKAPAGIAISSAHAVDREFRVLRALYAAGFAVPRPLLLQPQRGTLDAPFFLMEAVRGTVFVDPALPDLAPAVRRQVYTAAIRAAAALHALPPAALGLETFAPPGAYYTRQLRRLAAVSAAQARRAPPLEGLDAAVAGLAARAPPDERCLIHGDFKVDNMMFELTRDAHTPARLVAVLDWEMSTLGHPLADVATLAAAYWLPRDTRSAAAAGTMMGLAGVDVGWEATGIPSEPELLQEYARAAGRPYPLPGWPFFKAFWFFKYAVIAQGIGARAAAGAAASRHAGAAAAAAPLLMALCLSLLEEGGSGGGGSAAHPSTRARL